MEEKQIKPELDFFVDEGLSQSEDVTLRQTTMHEYVPLNDKRPFGRHRIGNWIGNTYVLWERNGVPVFTIGPHWYFYLILNSIIQPFCFCCIYFVLSKASFWATLGGVVITAAQFFSYTLCSLLNPGIPPKNRFIYEEESLGTLCDQSDMYCPVCGAIKHHKNN